MKLPRYGFWSMMHEARTDFSMWLGLLFLLIVRRREEIVI
jgi:putative oxidoreductase